MDEQVAGALSTLITALATAVLMAATYYWGPRGRRRKDKEQEDEE